MKLKEAYKALFEEEESLASRSTKKYPFKVSVDLPPVLYKKFRLFAVAKEKSIQKLLVEIIQEKITKEMADTQ